MGKIYRGTEWADAVARLRNEEGVQSISGSRPFREVKVFEDEVRDALQRDTPLVEYALDALLAALRPGDKLVLEYGDHVSLATFGVVRAVGREAVKEALGRSNDETNVETA